MNQGARLRASDAAPYTDATGRVLSEEEVRMWGRVMQQNADHEVRYQYIEARRREMDTESNWSTNAAVGGPGVNQGGVLPSRYVPRNWEYRN